ncbi:MAG: hypothetical protein ACKN9U_25115, partial [Pirellulaceae bacterium]
VRALWFLGWNQQRAFESDPGGFASNVSEWTVDRGGAFSIRPEDRRFCETGHPWIGGRVLGMW